MERKDALELMYRESGVLRQSGDYDADRLNEARERLQRAAEVARSEDLNISEALLKAAENGQSTECNALSAEKLNKPKHPSK